MKQQTLSEWLAANPRVWDGWPTRTLWQDDFDRERLNSIVAKMPVGARSVWFRYEQRPEAMYAAISSEVSDLRLRRRRAYQKSVAAA